MSPAPPIAPRSASALPTWDEVESGHPPGATNPPLPMLALSADGEHCYKEWLSPMRPTDQLVEAIKIGGRVLAEGEQSTGTEVQCPDNAEAVRARAAAATPEGG
jgi:hypothetical protein